MSSAAAAPYDSGLSPCPCGGYAVWYREARVDTTDTGSGPALRSLTVDDMNENLCAECFLALVGENERAGWTHAAPRERGIDQTPRYDPREVCDVVPSSSRRGGDWD